MVILSRYLNSNYERELMMDANKKQYKKLYKNEFDLANKVLGGGVEWSPHDYEAFIFKNDDVCLVFYPHKTSAWNYHIRVRDNGSKDKEKAKRLMQELDHVAGSNCTFSKKH